MPPSPLFTILLPTHNRPEVLAFAIQSVLDQTVDDFELLVIGDGCTDNTAGAVGGFADDRIRWFDLPKAPHFGYANRNAVLQEASGAFIAFMAHDDLWLPDHLELLLPFFEDEQIEIAYSRPLWVSPEGHVFPLSFNLHDPQVLEEFLSRKRNSLPAACFIYRSRCLERYGAWDENLPQAADWDLWARIIRGGGGGNFAYLPTPTCLHFRANWRTEANPGPEDLLTWKLRSDKGFPAAASVIAVDGFPTEQAAFSTRLRQEPLAFPRQLRIESQRLLDRLAMDGDLGAIPFTRHIAHQEEEIRYWRSRQGVFQHVTPEPGVGVVFGPGFFPAEKGKGVASRWLWREASMMIMLDSFPAVASVELRCDRDRHYDRFPLDLEVSVNGVAAGFLTFRSSQKKLSLDLALERPVNELAFRSNAAFVPAKCGVNDDQRQLSLLMTGLSIKPGPSARVKKRFPKS